MGSILRVKVIEADVPALLASCKLPIYGAVLEGKSLQVNSFTKEGVLIIGNESKGIRPALINVITDPVTIPKFGAAESLNAAVATGILLAAFRH